MKKRTIGWLIAATALILAGGILFTGVMSVLNWDFRKLSTNRYETNTHAITDAFTHISVTTTTAAVSFEPSEDGTVSVVCHEDANAKHRVAMEGDTLIIEQEDHRKWYQHVGLNFEALSVTVYLPEGAYGDLTLRATTGKVYFSIYHTFDSMDVKVTTGEVSSFASVNGTAKIVTTTGHIHLKSLNAGSLDLSVSTGDIQMKNIHTGDLRMSVTTGETSAYRVKCVTLTSAGSTGDLLLRDVVAEDFFSITRSTGDVVLEDCDAAALTITTDTGDVTGTLRTQKQFAAHSDTGHVTLPHLPPAGGPCTITTDTGNVYITLTQTEE